MILNNVATYDFFLNIAFMMLPTIDDPSENGTINIEAINNP